MKSRDKTRPKLYRDLLILRLSARDRLERFESFAVRCLFSVVYPKITKHNEMLCLIDINVD